MLLPNDASKKLLASILNRETERRAIVTEVSDVFSLVFHIKNIKRASIINFSFCLILTISFIFIRL